MLVIFSLLIKFVLLYSGVTKLQCDVQKHALNV